MPVGAIISQPFLAISLVAPLIPLGFLLAKKGNGMRRSTLLLGLLLSANLVSAMFIQISIETALHQVFVHIVYVLQIIFSALLLRGCTDQLILQQIILTIISIYAASSLTLLLILPKGDLSFLIQTGFGVVFILSILVLTSLTYNSPSLLSCPEFWYTGGIFFFYGLLSIMIVIPQLISLPRGDHSSGTLGSICYLAQSFLFCKGIAIQRT